MASQALIVQIDDDSEFGIEGNGIIFDKSSLGDTLVINFPDEISLKTALKYLNCCANNYCKKEEE